MKSNEREARRRAESNANHDYDWHVYVSFAYRVLASQGRPIIADVPRERERERKREDPLEIASKITFEFAVVIAADIPQPRARDLYRGRVRIWRRTRQAAIR
jgi:hypothetical protein